MKTGLVLEGGAMRGLFSAGVIDSFLENDITFDATIGVSAGAAFGCNLKSKQIGRVLRYNTRFAKDKRYCSLRSWITTGDLYNAKFCYHILPLTIDIFDIDAFIKNPMDFFIVCTDVKTGLPVYKKMNACTDNDLEWLRASASMPLASKIVSVDGYSLLDGGIADSIPVRYFEKNGYVKNVIILTRPKEYRKKKNKLMPLLKIAFKKYPAFLKVLENRHLVYNETLDYIEDKEKKGDFFVIRPPVPLSIGKVERNAEKMRLVHKIGKETAEKRLNDLLCFLKA